MPKLKFKEYQILKNDPIFRDKNAVVCEKCILKILKVIENYEKLTKYENDKFK